MVAVAQLAVGVGRSARRTGCGERVRADREPEARAVPVELRRCWPSTARWSAARAPPARCASIQRPPPGRRDAAGARRGTSSVGAGLTRDPASARRRLEVTATATTADGERRRGDGRPQQPGAGASGSRSERPRGEHRDGGRDRQQVLEALDRPELEEGDGHDDPAQQQRLAPAERRGAASHRPATASATTSGSRSPAGRPSR